MSTCISNSLLVSTHCYVCRCLPVCLFVCLFAWLSDCLSVYPARLFSHPFFPAHTINPRGRSRYFKLRCGIPCTYTKGAVAQYTDGLRMQNLTFETTKESGRGCACAADLLHFSGCRGLINVTGGRTLQLHLCAYVHV